MDAHQLKCRLFSADIESSSWTAFLMLGVQESESRGAKTRSLGGLWK